ncbi:MAG: hypothetical protein V4636_23490 [Pseudomonadota bacterium]
MTKIQARRKLIVIILLCVAVCGAVIRQRATPGTTTRDIGTLLMLLWIPIVGNIIAWLVAQIRRKPPAALPSTTAATDFDPAAPFAPQLQVSLTLRPPQLPSEDVPLAEGQYRCALVVDNQGFTARWVVQPGESMRRGQAQDIGIEFLSPALALPRFAPDTVFRMMVGESFIADGRVLRLVSSV